MLTTLAKAKPSIEDLHVRSLNLAEGKLSAVQVTKLPLYVVWAT